MSVAMALAECTHHSAPRGQKTARAGGGARDELHGYAPVVAPPQGPVVQEQVVVQAILRVDGSLPPCEVSAAPVFDRVHQEPRAAGEITENIVEFLLFRNR